MHQIPQPILLLLLLPLCLIACHTGNGSATVTGNAAAPLRSPRYHADSLRFLAATEPLYDQRRERETIPYLDSIFLLPASLNPDAPQHSDTLSTAEGRLLCNRALRYLMVSYNLLIDFEGGYRHLDSLQRLHLPFLERYCLRGLLTAKAQMLMPLDRHAEARKNNQELRNSYATLQGSLDKSLQQNSQGNINISKLVDEINASNRYIKQLVDTKSKSDSLNVVLTNNLTRSLSREELKEVDVKVLKGVVYISLADNMLYKSGSYEINERAGETLSKIAKIITDYKGYEVLVEGNTDNVPISRPNIRNNWDLSALRASSVVQALQNQYGVDPKRLSAAGRGEYNPLTDNDTELGKQRNRRTQIIITPKLDQFLELIDKAPEAEEEAETK